MLATLNKIADVLAIACDWLARIGIIFVAVILFVQVALRYGFNTGMPWPEEAARYTMIWVTMLAGGLLIRDEQLLAVDFFDKHWSPRALRYRNALFRMLLAAMLAVLFWVGLEQALYSAFRTTVALQISWFWPYLAVPVGAAIMLLNMLLLAIRDFTTERASKTRSIEELEPLG